MVQVHVDRLHIQLARPVEHDPGDMVGAAVLPSDDGQSGPELHLLLRELPQLGQLVVHLEVLNGRVQLNRVVISDVAPLLSTPALLILGPLHLDLAPLPGKDEDDARHLESQGVELLQLHAQDLRLPLLETYLDLVVAVLLDHEGMHCLYFHQLDLILLLALHPPPITTNIIASPMYVELFMKIQYISDS